MQSCVTCATRHDTDDSGHSRVLVVMSGDTWSQLPPTWHLMPPMTPDIMRQVNFIYPPNCHALVKYLSGLTEPEFPHHIIVADFDKLVEKSSEEVRHRNLDRNFNLNFARVSGIIKDFCTFFSSKTEKPTSSLQVFSKLNRNQVSMMKSRLQFWYSECWDLEPDKIRCISSKPEQSIKFFLHDNQYYLDSVCTENWYELLLKVTIYCDIQESQGYFVYSPFVPEHLNWLFY